MQPEQCLAQLLSGSVQHSSPCGNGELKWQEWSSVEGSTPLLLLHGGFGSWNHWVANIPELRKLRSLWTLDMPGLGDSAALPAPQSSTHAAQIILKGINLLLGAKQSFDLAGFSFGAMVAGQLAVQAGSRCQHLVLCGAAGFGDLHVQVELMHPPRPGQPEAEVRAVHAANLRGLMFASNETIDELALFAHASNLARARLNSRALSRTDELACALPAIKARLSGIWGSKDATAGGRPTLEKRRQLFQQAQPDAQFHIMSGVGHWAMYEAAGDFNRLLLAGL
ncbi:MAG: alpha/beta fold hydrolase [Gammaproteobacteria bacterium]|nr:alpha/beta fold hydrolase [Gammaproteobacteria bacterium]